MAEIGYAAQSGRRREEKHSALTANAILHSIIASIIGVAGAGFRLSLVLNAVGSEISNAECDIHSIAKGISLFSLMLKQVGKTMEEGRTVASQSAIETATEIRDQSQVVFDEIKNMVDLAQGRDEQGNLRSITIAQRVKWCFKKRKVQYLLGQLESLKLSLSIMLQILQMGKAIAATRDDPSRAPLTEHTTRQDRAEIQNMIVVQHWSLVELRKLYELAEKEAKEETTSPTIEDPPPSYDAAGNAQTSYYEDQASNGNRRLSIQPPAVPEKTPDDSQAMVKFEEKPIQQLDQQFTLALTRENQALGAPVYDIVNHLLHEWTRIPEAESRPSPPNSRGHPSPPNSRGHPSPPHSRKNSNANPSGKGPYYESDEDTSDSEFERSSDIAGRYIEGPRKGVEKNVRFRARVESDEEEQDHHRSRRQAPKKHVLHSEDDTSTDTESDVSPTRAAPGSRRSSDSSNVPYSREGPERRPRPYSGRSNGPENAGRPITRGMTQPSIPQGRPLPNQPWHSTPSIPTGLRPQQPYGPPGGPPRMPSGSPYVPAGYMGQSPQPPPGNYFPQQQQRPPGPPMASRQPSHRDKEKRRSAEKDASSASKNLRRGLFGGAAVAGILDLLQGLDGL